VLSTLITGGPMNNQVDAVRGGTVGGSAPDVGANRTGNVHGGGRPTMKDVAAKAGVALKTVSRVVNGEPGVTPETAKRVLGAIENLGFRRNESARLLRTGRTATLGFIADDWADPDRAAVYRGFEDVARANGYLVYSGSTGRDPEREERLVLAMCARRVDGLIVIPTPGSHDYLVAEIEAGVATVFVLRTPAPVRADAVLPDERGGGRAAVAHLIAQGHRRIGFVGGDPAGSRSARLLAGYEEAMAAAGLTADPAWTRLDPELVPSAPVTAVLCGDRTLTEATLHALAYAVDSAAGRDRGPGRTMGDQGRMAVVGFGDFALADLVSPPVTVVSYDPVLIGRTAGELLIRRLAGEGAPPHTVEVPVRLIARLAGEEGAEDGGEDRDGHHDRGEDSDLGPGRAHLPGCREVVVPPRGEGLEPRGRLAGVAVSLCHKGDFNRLGPARRGERVCPFDQSGQHDHAPCPLHERLGGDPLHYLLEVPDIGGPDMHQRVGVPGHRAGVRHLRVPPDRRGDHLGRGGPAAEQLHVRLGRPAERGRIDPSGEPGDRAGRAKPVHPPLDGRRRQANLAPDHRVAGAGVPDQHGDDPRVDLIQAHQAPSWHPAPIMAPSPAGRPSPQPIPPARRQCASALFGSLLPTRMRTWLVGWGDRNEARCPAFHRASLLRRNVRTVGLPLPGKILQAGGDSGRRGRGRSAGGIGG